MNRNSELLGSFITYCNSHPDERFWQALRNWSGHSFIYASNMALYDLKLPESIGKYIEDTFHWEKNK